MDRFLHPDLSGSSVVLDEGESHHLARVLRKQIGDEIELFDGKGGACRAIVTRVGKSVAVELVEPRRGPAASKGGVRVACAVPKGERFKWLVEKLTEIGVDELQPLITRRSVVEPGDAKIERLEQQVIAACKQCGRNDLMAIHRAVSWADFLAGSHGRLFIADQTGTSPQTVESGGGHASTPAESLAWTTIAVGPEGGWTDEELRLGRSAGTAVALCPYILRVETAAILGGAWLVQRKTSPTP
jgi:16S rRNA (uracil1498-N3)-methyltransferase